jgi:hypothetical protein
VQGGRVAKFDDLAPHLFSFRRPARQLKPSRQDMKGGSLQAQLLNSHITRLS